MFATLCRIKRSNPYRRSTDTTHEDTQTYTILDRRQSANREDWTIVHAECYQQQQTPATARQEAQPATAQQEGQAPAS